jgi:hypothetical protein
MTKKTKLPKLTKTEQEKFAQLLKAERQRVASLGGQARNKKFTRAEIVAWAKLGGRPKGYSPKKKKEEEKT